MTITKEQLKILKALYDLGMRYICVQERERHCGGEHNDKNVLDAFKYKPKKK